LAPSKCPWIGFLNDLFYGRCHIAGPGENRELSIPFLLDKKPTVVPGGSAGERSEPREVCRITPLARTQSERCRRLALAGGFRLLRLSGINRIAAQGSAAGRGWKGLEGCGR
jgi:hypothetical protein